MRLRSVRRPLRGFAQIDGYRRLLVIEAVLCLSIARLALILIPFPRVAGWLGSFVPPTDIRISQSNKTATPEQATLAKDVGWAVTRAARHVPFKAVCLPQAMAAQFMLRRRGVPSVMHFGATKSVEKPLNAHAWLDAGGIEVTGYPVDERFAEIACFV